MRAPEFKFGDITGQQLMRTGLNGLLNVRTFEVRFCARGGHLELASKGRLEGIGPDQPWFGDISEGGCTWRRSDCDLEDVLIWLALRDWVHFVHHEGDLEFATLDDTQVRVARAFSREFDCGFMQKSFFEPAAIDALRAGMQSGAETEIQDGGVSR